MDQQTKSRIQKRSQPILSWPTILVCVLIIAYAVFFSVYASQKHLALQTYAADLSYFDQPMWNTLHGRFMERTLQDRQAPRMTDHFEPILVPLSALYLIWNDVRVLLVLQAVALALGALPVYWIARAALSKVWGPQARAPDNPRAPAAEWLALAFALVYLLFPAQQAANLADFHADPLIVAPLLFAFWFAIQRRYGWMWVSAIAALAVKENLPSVTFMLGLVLVLSDESLRRRLRSGKREVSTDRVGEARGWLRSALGMPWVHGVVLMGISLAWLYIAMFQIVGPAARQFYGTEGPVYLSSRFGEMGAGAVAQFREILGRIWEAPRLAYLAALFASVGWLALLAPGYLLLGLPVLIVNMISVYPGQYSGEQHYSAPLVPAFTIAAIYGMQRLGGWVNRRIPEGDRGRRSRTLMAAGFGAWLLGWALVCQVQHGWSPIGSNFAWPQVTEHARLLERFTAQIPPGAAVSTTPPLNPHLSHRRVIYQFPTIEARSGVAGDEAEYVLVDVAGVTDMHPNDVRRDLIAMLQSRQFGLVDAADGYVLLSRSAAATDPSGAMPDAFYDFARAGDGCPQHPLNIVFGDSLRLLGYDIEDDPKWRQTRYRFYWQALAPLPEDTMISIQMLTPWGAVADDTALRPMPALLWYPPPAWKTGETVVTETVPWYLPRAWAPVIQVSSGGQALRPLIRDASQGAALDVLGEQVRLQPRERRGGRVIPFQPPGDEVRPADVVFAGSDWAARLTGYAGPESIAPGRDLPVTLHWEAAGPSAESTDFTVFLHLRDGAGRTVANADATPTWFTSLPTSKWSHGGEEVWDAHALSLPADLVPGRYALVAGWYDWRTGDRLPVLDAEGNASREEYVLGSVTVSPGAAPVPDLCCLYAQECCASQE
jgi:uncharacterized membrane protein